jgi:hypothetical protein
VPEVDDEVQGGGGSDRLVGAALWVGGLVYVLAQPRALGLSDEAYYLYHAKRLLHGEVLYRDVFDFITPLFTDLFAFLFRIFGTTMTTARVTAAVIHASMMLVLYRLGRAVGAPRTSAVAVAVAYVALCEPVWPFASPHWVSSFLMAVLLLSALDRQRARSMPWIMAQGAVLGTLVAVQQQKGVIMTAGMLGLVGADALLDRRFGARPGVTAAARAGGLLVGTLLVAVPIVAVHAMLAGLNPLWHDLVVHPFTRYHDMNRSTWAGATILSAPFRAYTVMPVLKYLPFAIPAALVELALAWRTPRDRERLETIVVLLVLVSCGAASILYFPDFIHVAFIAPLFFVLVAQISAWLGDRSGVPGRIVSGALAIAVLAALGVKLTRNMAHAHAEFPLSHPTAFGRLAFHDANDVALVEKIRTLSNATASRELFCYPAYAALYLMTDTNNPTPHEILVPGYQDEAEIDRVIATLERRQVPLVYVVRALVAEHDPVLAYVQQRYECGKDWVCVRRGMAPVE